VVFISDLRSAQSKFMDMLIHGQKKHQVSAGISGRKFGPGAAAGK